MTYRTEILARTVLAALMVVAAGAALAQELNPARRHPDAAADVGDAEQVLVRFKSVAAEKGRAQALSASAAGDQQVATLVARTGVGLRQARRLGAALQVLEVEPLAGETLAARLERLRADPSVEYAEPDLRRYPHAAPNDPLYAGQWYLQARSDAPAAIDAEHAWDISKGTAGVVIAVLDTGVLYNHPDLKRASAGGRLLPGYDFVSSTSAANDGDGRDANPTDPGDWVTQADVNTSGFAGCSVSGSSWHGSRVSGIIAARTNNSEGVAGVTWSPWILPVRVLGKCGGRDSDILAGMLWAAGIHVDGVPDNAYPAKIENMSLGSSGANGCPAAYRDVIREVSARGTLVVVSAGNEGGPVDVPANCAGAAAIAGLRHAGTKVGYSSLGSQVAVSAPAGNCVNTGVGQPCLFSIDTTYNLGQQTAGAFDYTSQINANFGTSFSAPIVAGIAGLMASVNGNLSAADLRARLREGAAKPFPVSPDPTIPQCHLPAGPADVQNTECSCTTSVCGAGMANAPGALTAALRPIAAVAVPASVSAGQNVTLSAANSAAACGRTVATYAWSTPPPNGVTNPTGPTTAVVAPTSGTITVHLTVTDDAGRTDTADVVVSSSAATTTAPADAGDDACPAEIAAPAPVKVTVAPDVWSLSAGGGTQTFVAVVQNAQDMSVVWQVNGTAGGNSTVGTISVFGTYTPPAAAPSPATVTVTAVSNEDPASSGSAQVTVTAAVVAPASSGGGGGGGGGAGLDLLILCAALLGARRSLAPRRRPAAAPQSS